MLDYDYYYDILIIHGNKPGVNNNFETEVNKLANLANKEIKDRAKEVGVYHWEIAERLQIQDSAFSRKLRRELSPMEKAEILDVIDKLAAEKAEVS